MWFWQTDKERIDNIISYSIRRCLADTAAMDLSLVVDKLSAASMPLICLNVDSFDRSINVISFTAIDDGRSCWWIGDVQDWTNTAADWDPLRKLLAVVCESSEWWPATCWRQTALNDVHGHRPDVSVSGHATWTIDTMVVTDYIVLVGNVVLSQCAGLPTAGLLPERERERERERHRETGRIDERTGGRTDRHQAGCVWTRSYESWRRN